MLDFKNDELSLMNSFQSVAGVQAVDVLNEEQRLVFVVEKGALGKALGREAGNLERLRKAFGKNVEVVEGAGDWQGFLQNLFRGISFEKVDFSEDGKKRLHLTVVPDQKARAIGRGGEKINRARALLKRHYGFEEVRIL